VTDSPDPTPPNWWRRRSGRQQVALVAVVLLVLVVLTPSEDPEPATASKDTKPKRQAAHDEPKAAPKTPDKPEDPIKALERDVRKNAKDQVGGRRVAAVDCVKEGRDVLCMVDYRLGDMWDADDDEVARDVGGMLHELFRDTTVEYLHVSALTTTVDELGNETKDDQVAWVIIRRSGWEKVDWDNLQYQSPMKGLRAVSEVYADTLRN
jgi:hypothetical protein